MRLSRLRRSSLLRLAGFVVFMAGLFLFQIIHSTKNPTHIRIDEISPLLNFSTVRVQGALVRNARELKSGAVFYLINDKTGTLAAFDANPAEGPLLVAGCEVKVIGSLNVGIGNDRRLNIESITVLDAESGRSTNGLRSVTASRAGERVCLVGSVLHSWAPEAGSRAPYKIVLADAGGELDVVHWLSDVPGIKEGDRVEVSGVVSVYKGEVQVKVYRSGDIRCVSVSDTNY